jgi:hypothetical protein
MCVAIIVGPVHAGRWQSVATLTRRASLLELHRFAITEESTMLPIRALYGRNALRLIERSTRCWGCASVASSASDPRSPASFERPPFSTDR